MIKVLLSVQRAVNPKFKLTVVEIHSDGSRTKIGNFRSLQVLYEPRIKRLRTNKLNELAAELALAKVAYDNLKQNGHYYWDAKSASFTRVTASVLAEYAAFGVSIQPAKSDV